MGISVEDQLDIERLMFRYARCADHKDYDGFGEVFCADAVFEYRGEPVVWTLHGARQRTVGLAIDATAEEHGDLIALAARWARTAEWRR